MWKGGGDTQNAFSRQLSALSRILTHPSDYYSNTLFLSALVSVACKYSSNSCHNLRANITFYKQYIIYIYIKIYKILGQTAIGMWRRTLDAGRNRAVVRRASFLLFSQRVRGGQRDVVLRPVERCVDVHATGRCGRR